MKISEIIQILESELQKRGDVDVVFHGCYGATETLFEVMPDKNLWKPDRVNLNVWTGIMTG